MRLPMDQNPKQEKKMAHARFVSLAALDNIQQRADRYLKVVNWARDRYTVNGALRISTGSELSEYSKIEATAYERYLS